MQVSDLKGKTIAFAASGGLDSCTITRWLTDEGVNVVAFTADLAQPDEKSLDAVRDRMLAAGASDFILMPLQASLAEAGLAIIQAQACYEGRYWNTTGIARHVVVEGMIPEMRKRGIDILSHGATGRGNDQVRFQIVCNMLEPQFEVYCPWRDQAFLDRFGGRSEMIDFCQQRGLNITATKDAPYSTDANLLGLTHEAGRLESLETPAHFVAPEMGRLPIDAPDDPEQFTVRFEKGRPVAVNGDQVSVLDAILRANTIAGPHGVGIATHLVENRFVGVKSRGVYEAPGMELIGTCYKMLLDLILDRRAKEMFDQLSLYLAKQIYQGYWFDLGSQIAEAAVGVTAKLVTGEVTVSLYKGSVSFVSAVEVPHSLYSEANASMESIGEFDHADSEGFLRVLAVGARSLASGGQIAN